MKPTYCKGCGAQIIFLAHPETGKPHPYELDQTTSHFINCKNRHRFTPARAKKPGNEQLGLFGDIQPDHYKTEG